MFSKLLALLVLFVCACPEDQDRVPRSQRRGGATPDLGTNMALANWLYPMPPAVALATASDTERRLHVLALVRRGWAPCATPDRAAPRLHGGWAGGARALAQGWTMRQVAMVTLQLSAGGDPPVVSSLIVLDVLGLPRWVVGNLGAIVLGMLGMLLLWWLTSRRWP